MEDSVRRAPTAQLIVGMITVIESFVDGRQRASFLAELGPDAETYAARQRESIKLSENSMRAGIRSGLSVGTSLQKVGGKKMSLKHRPLCESASRGTKSCECRCCCGLASAERTTNPASAALQMRTVSLPDGLGNLGTVIQFRSHYRRMLCIACTLSPSSFQCPTQSLAQTDMPTYVSR